MKNYMVLAKVWAVGFITTILPMPIWVVIRNYLLDDCGVKLSCENQVVTAIFLSALASLITSSGVVIAFKKTIKSLPDFELGRAYISTCIIGGIIGVVSPLLMAAGAIFGVIGIVLLLFYASYKLSVRIYALFTKDITKSG